MLVINTYLMSMTIYEGNDVYQRKAFTLHRTQMCFNPEYRNE